MAYNITHNDPEGRPAEFGVNPLESNPHLARSHPYDASGGSHSGVVTLVAALLIVMAVLFGVSALLPSGDVQAPAPSAATQPQAAPGAQQPVE